jgi:hypothetical protein
MENETVKPLSTGVEKTLLFAPGRVKQGLLWLQSEDADRLGLSLDRLIDRAILNSDESEEFNVMCGGTCALGYASQTYNGYYEIGAEKHTWWMHEHGFALEADLYDSYDSYVDAYWALTNEWRTQLQALADERGRE